MSSRRSSAAKSKSPKTGEKARAKSTRLREFNVTISKKDNGVYLVDTYGYAQKGEEQYASIPKHNKSSVYASIGAAIDAAVEDMYLTEGHFA